MLSLEEKRRIIKEVKLFNKKEWKKKGKKENHPCILYFNSLLNPNSKDFTRKVTSLVFLAISDANGEFLLD